MMLDASWLTAEANKLHGVFLGLFYPIVGVLLLLGVLVEYFKLPLGGVPSFAALVGRTIVAAILMHSYIDIANTLANVADAFVKEIGGFHAIDLVIKVMSDQLSELTLSWVSVKQSVVMAVSYFSFFALYFSKFVSEGLYIFIWTLCYVCSPLLISLYVLPTTAGATSGLFRTLFEVSAWKAFWSILATLLWSSALTKVDNPNDETSFIAIISMNLALAGSLLLTPWVVHALSSKGLASFARTVGGIAVGSTMVTPSKIISKAKSLLSASGRINQAVGSQLGEGLLRVSRASRFPLNHRRKKHS